jgi:hypothetical protein
MISDLINVFDYDIANCLIETNSILIEVYDCYDCIPDLQRCYIKIEDNQPVHFALKNPSASDLVFVALDNCVFKSHQGSRCDFIIGNYCKLYFVEIKQVKKGKRSQARTDAIQQLESSISTFRGKINLTNTEIIAVICLKAKQVHPLQSATRGAQIVAFKENYNAALMEGQSHTF